VVFSERRLRLRYRSGGGRGVGELAERVVDPYGLVCKSGIWYLVADQDGEPRLFRVSRVVSAPEVRDDLAAVAAATVDLYDRTLHHRTRV
jgi:predicted DNA-binding transcriptional regulator YafY